MGKSTQKYNKRGGGHRSNFFKLLKYPDIKIDPDSDEFSLGLHLFHEHGLRSESDFDATFTIYILEKCSPSLLDKREHILIHKYNTLYPFGLNKVNPFGIALMTHH